MDNYNFINGDIVSEGESVIGIRDLGLQRGYAVFDYARTFNKKLFHFDDHLKRLRNSSSALNLNIKYSDAELTESAIKLVELCKFNDPAIRIIVTGGYSNSSSLVFEPNILIIPEETPTYHNDLYTRGAGLISFEYQRELPMIKSINYLNDIRLNDLRKKNNVFDVLYQLHDSITECPRSNFFIFINDILVTPKDFILKGVTRKIILDLAYKFWPIEEREISFAELNSAHEAFITSTTKNIIPVTSVDKKNIGDGRVGKRTNKLMQLFNDYIKKNS